MDFLNHILMIRRRIVVGLELDTPRRNVLPYVNHVLGDYTDEALSPLEEVVVTGLVSRSVLLERHSQEEDLRYSVFMVETHQEMGQVVDPRHIALGAVVKAAIELKRRASETVINLVESPASLQAD